MSIMVDALVDEATDADRRWFLRHPGRNTYVRGFVPGELPVSMPMGDGVAITVVRQIGKGVRLRFPVYVQRMPPDTEAAALRLLRTAKGMEA